MSLKSFLTAGNAVIRSAGFAVAIGIMFLFLACTSTPHEPPKKPPPPVFLEGHPRSILIMPPINKSLDVKGPLTFLTTSTIPLAESGYYVIPVTLSDQTFKQNGITIAEDAHAIPYGRLREIFGADAALYITITRFGTHYVLFDSVTEAAAFASIIDLKNGQRLWSGEVSLSESSQENRRDIEINSVSDFLVSLLGSAIEAALDQVINTVSNKAHDLGRGANYKMLSVENDSTIPYGPYHPIYKTD